MEDQNQQNSSTPPQPIEPPRATMSHEKIIQPSAELVQELKATQAEQAAAQPQPAQTVPAAVQAEPQNMAMTQPVAAAMPSQQPVATQSIYPEPTAGVGVAASPVPVASPMTPAAVTPSANNVGRTLTVRVVAGVLILLNLINAYNWYLEHQAGYTSIVNLVEICATIGLLVGIAMLKEIARSIYVFVSALLLVISTIGIIQLYAHKQIATPSNTPSPGTAQLRTMYENSLAIAERNPNPTPAQKEAEQQTQRDLDNLNVSSSSSSDTSLKVKQYLSEGLIVVVAVAPLIILTRPSIKSVFS